jgi:hypothetical protein
VNSTVPEQNNLLPNQRFIGTHNLVESGFPSFSAWFYSDKIRDFSYENTVLYFQAKPDSS